MGFCLIKILCFNFYCYSIFIIRNCIKRDIDRPINHTVRSVFHWICTFIGMLLIAEKRSAYVVKLVYFISSSNRVFSKILRHEKSRL